MIDGRQYAARQSQGERSSQEDNWGIYNASGDEDDGPDGLLIVLADGMGGHKGGAHASATAVDTFIDVYAASSMSTTERLHHALERGNDQIGLDSENNAELEGMGCTLVAVEFAGTSAHWISVGDSPLWLLRDGRLHRLNEDHSMVPVLLSQVEKGELSEEDAANHPQRNALRSAVIGDEIGLIDCPKEPIELKPGDRILLASDGLETLSEDEIESVAKAARDQESDVLADRLVAAVEGKRRRGQDNTTVIVVSPFIGQVRNASSRNWVSALLLLILLGLGALAVWLVFPDSEGDGNPAAVDTPEVSPQTEAAPAQEQSETQKPPDSQDPVQANPETESPATQDPPEAQ